MSDEARAFLAAIEQLPKKQFPATHGINAIFRRVFAALETRLPAHLLPLTCRLHAFCVRHVFHLEKRLHINPTFRLLLGLRVVPPGIAFMAAAASTVYILRYLYTHALDLLTNIIGVAYPAYQSMMAIEYGDMATTSTDTTAGFSQHLPKDRQPSLDKALGISEPSLDKKQWLMYWTIYGVLTTADHWAGSILRLFPMYRVAKIGILVWAQHRKYNGAAWLYDTFIKPLLPPPSIQKTPHAQINSARTDTLSANATHIRSLDLRIADAHSGSSLTDAEDSSDVDTHDFTEDSAGMHKTYSALVMPSVWGSAKPSIGSISKQDSSVAAALSGAA
ncbi:hypothetical protein FB645_003193 [Coemansia sp. IMI 203386]|nr:hypothetical protein FB645_003193 [Coemansia sp. IMI 203386]